MNYDEETWQNIIQQLSSDHQVNTIVQNYNYPHDIITIQKLEIKKIQFCYHL